MERASHTQPPVSFDFGNITGWDEWNKRFGRYRQLSGLNKEPEETQVSALIYHMGAKAENIFESFGLDTSEATDYQTVLNKFTEHFQPKINYVFERAQLNCMTQNEGQTAAEYAVALKKQALKCGFEQTTAAEARNNAVRDRFVISIRDKRVSRKLQMTSDLTLDKAIKIAVETEEVDKQQLQLGNSLIVPDTIAQIKTKGKSVNSGSNATKGYKKQTERSSAEKTKQKSNRDCGWCGGSAHAKNDCPARDKNCNKCHKKGHYGKVCRTTTHQTVQTVAMKEDCKDGLFTGLVNAQIAVIQREDFQVHLQIGQVDILFRIDTGADASVMPSNLYKENLMPQLVNTKMGLFGATGDVLKVQGQMSVTLKFNNLEAKETIFVCDNVQMPLLGLGAAVSLGLVARLNNIRCDNQYRKKYAEVFTGLGKLSGEPCKLKLKQAAAPKALKAPRRIPLALQDKVKEELDRMIQLGVVRQVQEPTEWCAPLVVVHKKNGTIRLCVDYGDLNENLVRDRTVLPTVDEILARLEGATVFTKLDQNCGFWQVPLAEESKTLTTFITPWGRYCFNRLPFGISIGPEHFQARIKKALEGCKGVEPLIDDTIIAGKDKADHDAKLETVMEAMKKAGIRLNENKCEFAKEEIKFLGCVVNRWGIKPDPGKISAVVNFPVPKDKKELLRFLGMVTQMGKFIPNLSELTQNVRPLLSDKYEWVWAQEQQDAVDAMKKALSTAPTLAHFSITAETMLSSDASAYGLGSVLLQRRSGTETWKPIAYASRTLTDAETRYAQIEKEALGIVWATEKFQDYLIGLQFNIQTDHKPLITIFTTKPIAELSARLQRFRLRMTKYRYSVEYLPGSKLKTADALSRAPIDKPESDTDCEIEAHVRAIMADLGASDKQLDELRLEQTQDADCKLVRKLTESGWPTGKNQVPASVQTYWAMRHELSVQEDLLVRCNRIVIPVKKRQEILNKLHSSHMGIEKTRQRANDAVWWPGMAAEIKKMIENCTVCLKVKTPRTEPLLPTELPDTPWKVVGTDLFHREGREYLLVTDYYSRFPEVMLLQSTTAEAVVQASRSIFARHGFPQVVRSDNGPQYIAEGFKKLSTECGFTHITSSPHFPRSNGLVEASVKSVKKLLARAKEPYNALLEFRTTPGPTGYSPAQMLMGRQLRTAVPTLQKNLKPNPVNQEWTKRIDLRNKLNQKSYYDRHHRVSTRQDLPEDTSVWITDLQREGRVISMHETPRSYLVHTDKGTVRRNKEHLQVLPEQPNEQVSVEKDTEIPGDLRLPSTESEQKTNTPSGKDSPVLCRTTRSGRKVKTPVRLNL